MNCEQFQGLLQDLARNEWLDVGTLKDAFEHTDTCFRCDDLLQEAEGLTADLHSLASADSHRQAPAYVEKNVLAAFAQQRSTTSRHSNVRLMTVASLTCIAALALFAVFLIHRRPASSPQGSQPSAVPTAKATNGVQQASVNDLAISAGSEGDALSAFEDEDNSVGSFVPLTSTFDRASLDGGAVVRVALSQTALQEFGLSAGHTNDKQVLADMVVASDGTPQAIRLVANQVGSLAGK